MDDEEDGFGDIGTSRYQAMPSLQSLQQMRNRLHTAFLGKRLMKWTALACGKEMRVLAGVIYEKQVNVFKEKFQEAYMQLARSRYYMEDINKLTLEGVGDEAYVTVQSTPRCVAGAKLITYSIVDAIDPNGNLAIPYLHLGLGRGGAQAKETKRIWRELLYEVIRMTELRKSYDVVYRGFMDATKKKNVMQKIVIPKTIHTIQYIQRELEELEREDFYRMKMIKQLKKKHKNPEQRRYVDSESDIIVGRESTLDEAEKEVPSRIISSQVREFDQVFCPYCPDYGFDPDLMPQTIATPTDDTVSIKSFKFRDDVVEPDTNRVLSFHKDSFIVTKKTSKLRPKSDEKVPLQTIETLASDLAKIISEIVIKKDVTCDQKCEHLKKEINRVVGLLSENEGEHTCTIFEPEYSGENREGAKPSREASRAGSTSKSATSTVLQTASSVEICQECLDREVSAPLDIKRSLKPCKSCKVVSEKHSKVVSEEHSKVVSEEHSKVVSEEHSKVVSEEHSKAPMKGSSSGPCPTTSHSIPSTASTVKYKEDVDIEAIFEEFRLLRDYIKELSMQSKNENSCVEELCETCYAGAGTSQDEPAAPFEPECSEYSMYRPTDVAQDSSDTSVINIPFYLQQFADHQSKDEFSKDNKRNEKKTKEQDKQ